MAGFCLLALTAETMKSRKPPVDKGKTRKIIMDKQLSDGGFSLDGSGGSDPDITAMVIQALAPYYTDSHPDVRAVVDKAVARLAALQNAAGGFKSWGSINSESVCQTIIALCAIGIDIDTDSRFIKNGNTCSATFCSSKQRRWF